MYNVIPFLLVAVFGIELGMILVRLADTLGIEIPMIHILFMLLLSIILYFYAGTVYVLKTKSRSFCNWITRGYKPTILSYLVILLWPFYGLFFACMDLHHALSSRNYNKDL